MNPDEKKQGILKKILIYGLPALAALLAGLIIFLMIPNRKMADLNEYYGVGGGEAAVFLNEQRAEIKALYENGKYYLPLDYVKDTLNERFYEDSESGALLYQLPDRLLTFKEGENSYTSGDESVNTGASCLIVKDGVRYLQADIVQTYTKMQTASFEEPGRIWLFTAYDTALSYAAAEKEVLVHVKKSIHSPVSERAAAGTRFLIAQEDGGWLHVISENGQEGYVKKNQVSEIQETTLSGDWFEEQNYYGPEFEGAISLGWDYIDDVSYGLDMLKLHLENEAAVNVVSPTWFRLSGSDGSFTSCADAAYVSLAHENGLQVFAMIENFTNECDVLATLSVRTSRTALIQNLLSVAAEYDLDGINLDFEGLNSEIMPHYLEFVRELKAACREKGLILSADTYPPYPYNALYDMPEMSRITDYLIVMCYDESWEEPGPNADLDFVTYSCEHSIEQASPDRLIIAVPFYTYAWSGTDGAYKRKEVFMKKSAELMASCADLEWLEDKGCYHGTAELDGETCEIWFEDLRSAETRLALIAQYDVKGIACWRLAQEDTGVWPLVEKYILK